MTTLNDYVALESDIKRLTTALEWIIAVNQVPADDMLMKDGVFATESRRALAAVALSKGDKTAAADDITAELDHYACRAMPHYPNDLCSRAKREIERLRGYRGALNQITGLAPEERTIPLDRAFAIMREMASIARNALGETNAG